MTPPVDPEDPTELDCRGQLCPQPIIDLARAIRQIDPGSTIAVTATDLAARYDIPAWCRMREQEYLGETSAADGTPRYLVRRLN